MNKTLLGVISLILTIVAVQAGENAVEKTTPAKNDTTVKTTESEKSKSPVDTQKATPEIDKKVSPKKKYDAKKNTNSNAENKTSVDKELFPNDRPFHGRHHGPPPEGPPHDHDGPSSIKQDRFQKFLFNQLPKEERAKLEELYKKNPAAYYDELKKIAQRLRKQDATSDKRVQQLAKQYKQEKDSAKKEKILKQISWITRRQFYFRLEENRRSLDEAERKLNELKMLYQARKKNAKAIIERRIKDLTDSNLDW